MSAAAAPLVATALVTINDPLALPPSFLGLEALFVVLGVITLAHAVRACRAGDGGALFAWASIFVYGLAIEIISYNFVDNFTHGQFTVMFYHRKLPLYITWLYPVFLYTALRTVGRLGLGRLAEPLAVGVVIVAIDLPFDILGPVAGWWSWADTDPNTAYRWHGVPVTSYYWHLAFGGVMAALCRLAAPFAAPLADRARGPSRLLRLAMAVPVAIGTLFLGVIAFLPFHAAKALGVRDGLVVGALIAVSALVLSLGKRDGVARPTEPALSASFALLYGFHGLVALALAAGGALPDPGGRLGVIAGAMILGGSTIYRAQRALRASAALVEA